MKKYIFIFSIFCVLKLHAQINVDDVSRLTIQAYVPSNTGIPNEAVELLRTKLSQIVTMNGIADNEYCMRFILTAKINVVSKDIVLGPPQRISQKLEITLMLGDIKLDKVYSSLTLSVMGVGTNINKSYISAIKNIHPNNSNIETFMVEGKNMIVDYYRVNCKLIMEDAKRMAEMQKFEEAIYQLTSVPDICRDCYDECSLLASKLYTDMIEGRGIYWLQQAQGAWAKSPNSYGAKEAINYLSKINFAASSQTHAAVLLDEITKKLINDDEREWEFKMQQYKDGIEREKRKWEHSMQIYRDEQRRDDEDRAFRQKQYEEDVITQRLIIQSCREIGIEYAKNQPKTINQYNKIIKW